MSMDFHGTSIPYQSEIYPKALSWVIFGLRSRIYMEKVAGVNWNLARNQRLDLGKEPSFRPFQSL